MKFRNLINKTKRQADAPPERPEDSTASTSNILESSSKLAEAHQSLSEEETQEQTGRHEVQGAGKEVAIEKVELPLSAEKETKIKDAELADPASRSGEHSNPRINTARKQLFEASDALSSTIAVYYETRKTEDVGPPLTENMKGAMSPEQLTEAVNAVILKQQQQKTTLSSRIGNAIGKIYPLASLTLGVGATIAESASFIPLKGAVNGLCLLLSISGQEQARVADFLKQLDRILYQALRVKEIQNHQEVDIGDLLLEKSMNLMTASLVFFNGAIKYFCHDYFKHVGQTILLGPQVYSDAKTALDTAISDWDQALLLEVTIKIFNMTTPRPIIETAGPSKTSDLIAWLKSSYWEVEAEFSTNCNDRLPNSLEWILRIEEFQKWRLSDKHSRSSRSLWLNGLPGVGKSVIAAYITQILQAQHPDAAVLHFFCKAGESKLDNVIQLIRTLAVQLLHQIPAARTSLQQLMDDDFKDSKSVVFMIQKLIRDSVVDFLQDVFIIIDGLDECDGNPFKEKSGGTDLERLLEGLRSLNVKLLVSSRPTPEISRAMSEANRYDLSYADSREDIQSYVTMCVSNSVILEKGFKALGRTPSELITETSQGNFLWVRIVINILKDTSSVKNFQEVIETIPKDLEDVYSQLLAKMKSTGTLELALTILEGVLYGCRSLTIQELEIASSILLGSVIGLKNFVETVCGSFLRVLPGEDSRLYIVHETFRSYITKPLSSKESCLLPAISHAKLATACLGCLIEPENSEFDSFRDYATEFFPEHLARFLTDIEAASDIEVLVLLSKLHFFLTTSDILQQWMKRYSFIVSELYNIGVRMANLHDVVSKFVKSSPVNRLAQTKTDDNHQTPHEALSWCSFTLQDDELASTICLAFTTVWIRSDWQETDRAKKILLGACHLWEILSPSKYSHKAMTRPSRQYVDPDTTATRDGWKFLYVGTSRYSLTLEELRDMAVSVQYKKQNGTESGNYAFGEMIAGSASCVQSFQSSIDDNPDCWHLHEGLGEYYETHGERDKAIKCYAEAMSFDPKNPPSAAYNHTKLVSAMKEETGDIEGAVDAWRVVSKNIPDSAAPQYWDAMVAIYEKTGNGNAMVEIYKEAIKNHPSASHHFWNKLAKTYGRGGARQEEFKSYLEAMKADPENIDEYGKCIRNEADELNDLCIWQPVTYMLTVARKEDPNNASKYHQELGMSYLCRREWAQAVEQLESYWMLTEDDYAYIDIGNACLGLGQVSNAIAAYEKGIRNKTAYIVQAQNLGYAHIIDENYRQAIRLFKLALADMQEERGGSGITFGQTVDDVKPQQLFEFHRALALCYEATDRPEDMKNSFEAAVASYHDTVLLLDADKSRNTLYRHEARAHFELGLVYEKLGRKSEAQTFLSRAAELFEQTTLDGDDEVQQSEEMEAKEALERVNRPEEEQKKVPDLREKIGGMRMQRRLALRYTTDWYVFAHWKPPRKRGGMDWNEVSFVNKFKINNGGRTMIRPWGFGHGE